MLQKCLNLLDFDKVEAKNWVYVHYKNKQTHKKTQKMSYVQRIKLTLSNIGYQGVAYTFTFVEVDANIS